MTLYFKLVFFDGSETTHICNKPVTFASLAKEYGRPVKVITFLGCGK